MVDDLVGSAEQHGSPQHPNLEPDGFEQEGERSVELEAPPASHGVDASDLGDSCGQIVRNSVAEDDVEVLERDLVEVGQLQPAEAVEVPIDVLPIDAESSEIPINLVRGQCRLMSDCHHQIVRPYAALVLIDLAINPFDAAVPDMIALAHAAEAAGAGGVWVADHFSGSVVGRSWSRDPFVVLAAIAATTERIDLGVLVANIVNRHPAQLASAVNSLQSIAPGRVRLGMGSGAAPGSRFAVEHEAIGTQLAGRAERRQRLVDSIAAVRAIWNGDETLVTTTPNTGIDGLTGVIDGSSIPTLIVGASAWSTIEVAIDHADGVNIRRTDEIVELLTRLGTVRPAHFEVSVLDVLDDVVADRGRVATYAQLGVDRLVLGISPPHDPARLASIDFTSN